MILSIIGTIFIDCKGFAKQNYQPDTRNLGEVRFVHGGVGRNVAETLGGLGIPAKFVSTVDATGIGREVVDRLKSLNIQTDFLQEVSAEGMGMFLAVLNEEGNLMGSISQMPNLSHLQRHIQEKGREIAAQSTHIALELDLNEEITRRVLREAAAHEKPVYGIPGNLDIILHHPDILPQLACFICNNFEADLLMKKDFTSLSTADKQQALIDYVGQTGMKSMVITLGEEGSVYYDASTKQSGYQPAFPVKVADTTGAGDAFFAGTVMGLVRGFSLKDAVICGTKAAGWTIESVENTCQDLGAKIEQDPFFQALLAKA